MTARNETCSSVSLFQFIFILFLLFLLNRFASIKFRLPANIWCDSSWDSCFVRKNYRSSTGLRSFKLSLASVSEEELKMVGFIRYSTTFADFKDRVDADLLVSSSRIRRNKEPLEHIPSWEERQVNIRLLTVG